MTTPARARPKPDSEAVRYTKSQGQGGLIRFGVFAGILFFFVIGRVPNPILGFDWHTRVWSMVSMLWTPMPPEPITFPIPVVEWEFVVPVAPGVQWLAWGLAAALALLVFSIPMHLMAIYAQRTQPLGKPRTYLRVTMPVAQSALPDSALLLDSMHGMVPKRRPGQPVPVPVQLVWSGRPDQRIQQGISIADAPTLVTALQKRILAARTGSKVITTKDPLYAAMEPGRTLLVGTVQAAAPSMFPIAMASQDVLLALLPTMACQGGVYATSLRIGIEPSPDRSWRMQTLAYLEQRKADLTSEEQAMLRKKTSGQAFRVRMQLFVIADDVATGRMQLDMMAASLSASMASIGMQTQRLTLGDVQTLPAMLPLGAPIPSWMGWVRWGLAGLLTICGFAYLGTLGTALREQTPAVLAVPLLAGLTVVLGLGVVLAQQAKRDARRQWQAAVEGVFPPENPGLIPLFAPWFGYPKT